MCQNAELMEKLRDSFELSESIIIANDELKDENGQLKSKILEM